MIDSMEDNLYYGATVTLIVIIITFSIVIKDPEVIFEVTGGMTVSLLCFCLPGWFFLSARS